MGVTGNLLKWLADFFTGRRQRVHIGDAKSEWETVHSGVPQGSVLGPILFFIYVHDYLDYVSCEKLDEISEMDWQVDAVYIGFNKAFDRVPHRRPIYKLRHMGVTGNLLKWLADFFTGRRQRVHIGDAKSEWETVHSGVPQGSVLGPILFLIYVHDYLDYVSCEKVLFADDLKM
nr:unnamed protein product [Spirometra erinaceieuropaei]